MGFKIKEVHLFSLRLVSLVALSSFAITTQFIDPINWPKQVALCVAVPLIFLTLLKMRNSGLVDNRGRKLNALFSLSLLGFGLTGILSSAPLVRTLWGTFGRNNGLVTQVALVLLAWLFSMVVITPNSTLSLLRAVQYLMYLPIVYGLIQYFGLDPIVWSTTNQVFSFFGNINFASAVFGLSGFVSSLLFVIENARKNRLFALLSFISSTVLTFLTGSLQGLIILGFGVFISLLVYIRIKTPRLALPYLFTGVIVGLIVLLGFFGLGPLGPVLEQYTLKLRLYYAQVGILMGFSKPLLGVGVDSYGDEFRLHRPEGLLDLIGLDIVVNNAHSSLVQIFATTGLLGLISILLLVFPAYILSIKILIVKTVPIEQVIIVAIFLGLFSASLLSIDNISIAVWNYMFLGLTLGIYRNPQVTSLKKTHKPEPKVFNNSEVLKLISRVATILLFTTSWISSNPARELVRIFNNPVFSEDQESLRNREINLVKVSNSSMLRESDYRLIADGLLAIGYTPTAAEVLRLGVARFPRDFTLTDYAAVVNEKYLSRENAIVYREQQVLLDERDSRIWVQLAYDYHSAGRQSEAEVAYNKALKFANFATLEFRNSLTKVAKDIQITS